MNARTASRVAWWLWGFLSILAALSLVFMVLTHRSAGELGGFVMFLAVGTVGR